MDARKYDSLGREGSRLGFPVAGIEVLEGDTRPHVVPEKHTRQRFEDGTIYESKHGAFIVRSDLAEYGAGIPIEDAVEATSPYGTTGVTQRFCRKLRISGDWEVLVCSSEEYGTFGLADHRLTYYRALGGAESWLGFPVSQQERIRHEAWLQRFEGGILYYPHGRHPAAVQKATLDLIWEPDGGTKLGWPVSEDLPIDDGADRIQFFDKGAVVLRDGKRKILVYPDLASAPQDKKPTSARRTAVPPAVPRSVPPAVPTATAQGNPVGEEGPARRGWGTFPR